jgi:hypothetical protein
MRDTNDTGRARNVGSYLLCYALLAVLFALTIALIFAWSQALVALISVLIGRSFANRAIYQVSLVLVVLALFIVFMGAEPYLRNGVQKGVLVRRFSRVAIPMGIALVVAFAIRVLAAIAG